MRKEWLLTLVSTVVTVVIALWLVRRLAPGLLGMPVDLQMVQTSREVPPFFEGVFRAEDHEQGEFLLNDPSIIVRGRPLYPDAVTEGPHDALGFRNRAVPAVVDVVVIGDSQTYGNNAPLELNWPGRLRSAMAERRPVSLYNMSVGAWGAVNYRRILESALMLSPRAIVIAFYAGNDSLSDFRNVYSVEQWAYLRPDSSLEPTDAPAVRFPVPEEEQWPVRLDGLETIFTPRYRLYANDREDPAVRAGYAIMRTLASEIHQRAREFSVTPVFTIIPTKELVYAERIEASGLDVPEAYRRLVADETRNLEELAAHLRALDGAYYADALGALRARASAAGALYPTNSDGHPLPAGYAVIGEAVAGVLEGLFEPLPTGLVGVSFDGASNASLQVLTPAGRYVFPSVRMALANGWTVEAAPVVLTRDVAGVPYLELVDRVDPSRFGPDALMPERQNPGPGRSLSGTTAGAPVH